MNFHNTEQSVKMEGSKHMGVLGGRKLREEDRDRDCGALEVERERERERET